MSRIVPKGATLDQIATGFRFTEGPLWTGDRLLFVDMPNNRILTWTPSAAGGTVETFRQPSNLSNGLTFDRQHRLIACEGVARRLTRTEPDGSTTTLVDRYEGKRLNSPNDVIVASNGTIYFSDPWWAHNHAKRHDMGIPIEEQELSFQGVFRLATDGTLTAEATDFSFPNGLALSPDERVLYVADSRHAHMRAFDLQSDGSLANDRVFAVLEAPEEGAPDGMKVDREGNVYCTGAGGVWVVAPSGTILGRIRTPEVPANLAWGDADWQSLYITARTSVYRIRLSIPGIPV
ncbi:MAG: SMP-30/gluconolactonase/LRE family protein [Chloroflexi bacterium]|nr:SMP-30/gluconolactonase/LRE family protein [Chloroflexota bacterium]